MALPTVEILVAPATEAFRANPRDPAVVGPILEVMNSCPGMIRTYYGVQHEDKVSAHVAVAWHSLADHQALMNDPVKYPQVGKELQTVVDTSAIVMYHCAFTSEPYKALEAPVTEIVTITLNEGESKDTLETLVDELSKGANAAPASAGGAISAAWGPAVEKDDLLFLIIGWPSVEAHTATVKSNQAVMDIISKIRAIAKLEVKHVALA
ncbi:hypothetical protein LXA43DRAFT_902359 [Ganoderma leucocontextum]|nr:hypothetical protein LXA43DRAFT_902359 [Ganoderma leucocontextum]